jgi:CRP-like cAMP-binding protein
VHELPDTLALQLNLVLKRRLIECVPMFSDISPMVMLMIIRHLQSIIALPNQVLIRQGDDGRCMYFVTRGQLCLYRMVPHNEDVSNDEHAEVIEGETVKLADFHSGSFFGEEALLSEEIQKTSVISETFSELEVLSKEDFDALAKEHEEVKEAIQYHSEVKHAAVDPLQIHKLLSDLPQAVEKITLDAKSMFMNKLLLKRAAAEIIADGNSNDSCGEGEGGARTSSVDGLNGIASTDGVADINNGPSTIMKTAQLVPIDFMKTASLKQMKQPQRGSLNANAFQVRTSNAKF